MSSLALRGRTRQWWTRLHRWTGLTVLLFLLLTALTGVVLAFRGEVDAWLNPELFSVAPATEHRPLGELIAGVESRYPGIRVSSVGLPQSATDSLRLFVRREQDLLEPPRRSPGMRSAAPFNQVFVDPYRGSVLGTRDTSAFVLDRHNFVPFLLRLHYSLFLEKWGVWLLGGCAVLWFLSNGIGLALCWPRGAASFAAWQPLCRVRRGLGSYKFNYDLHRAAGLLSLPVLAVVAFTSIYLNLPDMVKPMVAAISPLTATTPPRVERLSLSDPVLTPEAAIALAQARLPGSEATFLQRDLTRGVYSVRLKQAGDVGSSGDHSVWLAMRDGRVVGTRLGSERSAGDVFIAWMRPLHGGTAFGLPGQILIALSALALMALCLTGVVVWWRKQRGEKVLASRRRLASQQSQTNLMDTPSVAVVRSHP